MVREIISRSGAGALRQSRVQGQLPRSSMLRIRYVQHAAGMTTETLRRREQSKASSLALHLAEQSNRQAQFPRPAVECRHRSKHRSREFQAALSKVHCDIGVVEMDPKSQHTAERSCRGMRIGDAILD